MQATDPCVSRVKFERELGEFVAQRQHHEARGWFLVEAAFPLVFLIAAGAQPRLLLFGLLLDYTDYDAQPPSVKFVDPFTREPYTAARLPIPPLLRARPPQHVGIPGLPAPSQAPQDPQPLLQAHSPDDVIFLCLPGVREYHDQPGHSGDVWDRHRANGAGRLSTLISIIHKYGVEPVSLQVEMRPQLSIVASNAPL